MPRKSKGNDIQSEPESASPALSTAAFDPKERLEAAEKAYQRSRRTTKLNKRLDALTEAVELDPFSSEYRLALARTAYEFGLVDEALDAYRRALEFWPESPDANILYAEALIEAGQIPEARLRLKFAEGSHEPPRVLRTTLAYAECDLREGKWDEAMQRLAPIKVTPTQSGLVCEKCLKIIVESDDSVQRQRALELAREKAGRKPATLAVLERVAAAYNDDSDSADTAPSSDLSFEEGVKETETLTLINHLQVYGELKKMRRQAVTDDLETRLQVLNRHRDTLNSDARPGQEYVYEHFLGEWAAEAYRKKNYAIAETLWQEAQRVDPYNPAIIQNLAIVATRTENELGFHAYWNRVTELWAMHSELMPAATGFENLLVQKARAFVSGAQQKLQRPTSEADVFALCATWASELITVICLQQLEFKSPLYRCGVRTEDYTDEAQRHELVEAGSQSLERWVEIMHHTQKVAPDSDLAQYRAERISTAREAALTADSVAFQYDETERTKFNEHRDFLIAQYSQLILKALVQLSNHPLNESPEPRKHFSQIAECILSFPHAILKAPLLKDLIKTVDELRTIPNKNKNIFGYIQMLNQIIEAVEHDLPAFIENMALGFQLKKAQTLMERQQFSLALPWLDEVAAIAPDSITVVVLKIQCLALQDKLKAAIDLLKQAKTHFEDSPDKLSQLEQMPELLEQIVLNKAVPFINKNKWEEAKNVLLHGAEIEPLRPRIIYYYALCNAKLGNTKVAEDAARQALTKLKSDHGSSPISKADAELRKEVEQFIGHIPDIAISDDLEKAMQHISKQHWSEALPHLTRANGRSPNVPRVLFYLALCNFRTDKWDSAENLARQALQACKSNDEEHQSIREQCTLMLEQIPLARAGNAMRRAEAAMQSKSWSEGRAAADEALAIAPNHGVALFYKAQCELALGEREAATLTARRGLAIRGLDSQLRNVLNQIVEAANPPKWVQHLNDAVGYLNKSQWAQALTPLNAVLQEQPNNAQARFYRALSNHQNTMAFLQMHGPINSWEVSTYVNLYDSIAEDLRVAKSNSSDRDLSKTIRDLQTVVEQVRKQLGH